MPGHAKCLPPARDDADEYMHENEICPGLVLFEKIH